MRVNELLENVEPDIDNALWYGWAHGEISPRLKSLVEQHSNGRAYVMKWLLKNARRFTVNGSWEDDVASKSNLVRLAKLLHATLGELGPSAEEVRALEKSLLPVKESSGWKTELKQLLSKNLAKGFDSAPRGATASMIHRMIEEHPGADLSEFKDELLKLTLRWHHFISQREHIMNPSDFLHPVVFTYKAWLDLLEPHGWPELKSMRTSLANMTKRAAAD